MANKLVRQVTKQYIAGVPAVPPTPARCYTRTINASRTGSVGGAQTTFISLNDLEPGTGVGYSGFLSPVFGPNIDPTTGQREVIGYNALRFSPSGSNQSFYTSKTETICTPGSPGQEGVPAQIIAQNEGPDWRASARSIEQKSGDVTASFDINDKPRLIVGFATRDTGSNQSDIRMGVAFVQAGGATTQVVPILNGVQQPSAGNYTAGQRIALTRSNGRFFIQVGSDVVYRAEATTADPVFLDAMVYTSADFVDDPAFSDPVVVPIRGSVGFYAGMQNGAISMSVGYSVAIRSGVFFIDGEAGPGGVINSDLAGATMVLGKLYAEGSDKVYADARVSLKALRVEATGGLVSQSTAGGDVVMAPVQSYSTMLTGEVGTAEVTLKSFNVFGADRDYAEGQARLPRLRTYGDDGFGIPNYYGHNDSLEIGESIFTDPSLFASIYETLELETEMSLATLVSGTVLEGLILDPTLSVKDFLTALIESGINLSSATQMPDPIAAQYAFNAMTGAATRYSNFGFTQFARTGGDTYAVKPDGLYRLRPGDDAGERRSALVDFGAMAFGVQQRKNIETMYLGMSTDGTVYAKLKADNGEYKTYRVIQREPTMRVRTGKGVTAREWSVKLEVVDATRVDLDNVEFVVGASVRRWTR